MRTALDTSVLLAIAKGESDGLSWVRLLERQRTSGELVICDVVAAEYYATILNEEKFDETLRSLGVSYEPCERVSALRAGAIFRDYRNEGGPREHLIPDFLIGAHAAFQADQIAARDRGFLRRYFPRLKIIQP